VTNMSAAHLITSDELYDGELTALRDDFPDWAIHEVAGGLLAVPHGTETVDAITIDGLRAKLTS
jgi:hypothetical protein